MGLLARWSQRKSEPGGTSIGSGELPGTKKTPEHVSRTAAAPDTLDRCSDFAPFIGQHVADDIHVAAMRRLWLSSEIFGACDGLDVYCSDYRAGATADRSSTAKRTVDVAEQSDGSEPSGKG